VPPFTRHQSGNCTATQSESPLALNTRRIILFETVAHSHQHHSPISIAILMQQPSPIRDSDPFRWEDEVYGNQLSVGRPQSEVLQKYGIHIIGKRQITNAFQVTYSICLGIIAMLSRSRIASKSPEQIWLDFKTQHRNMIDLNVNLNAASECVGNTTTCPEPITIELINTQQER
jgi:hypothetical protein